MVKRNRPMCAWFGGMAALLLLSLSLAPGAARAETLKIVFPTPAHTYALPHLVAQDLGWLKQAGLDVDEQWLSGGESTAIRLIVAGDADIAVTGDLSAYSAIAAGAQIRAFAAQQSIFDFEIVAKKSIASIKDLAGKRIAVGGPAGDITLEVMRVLMRKYGADPDSAQFQPAGGTPQRLQALIAGQTDATILATAFALQAATYPQFHVLTTVPKELPGMGFSYLLASKKEIADPAKRKALETYTEQAVIRSSRYIGNHQDEALKILLKHVPSLDPKIGREAIAELVREKVFGVNGGIEPAITDYTVKFALDSKNLQKPLKYGDVVDKSIVDAALKKMGRI